MLVGAETRAIPSPITLEPAESEEILPDLGIGPYRSEIGISSVTLHKALVDALTASTAPTIACGRDLTPTRNGLSFNHLSVPDPSGGGSCRVMTSGWPFGRK
jgi:hypothetical protein